MKGSFRRVAVSASEKEELPGFIFRERQAVIQTQCADHARSHARDTQHHTFSEHLISSIFTCAWKILVYF